MATETPAQEIALNIEAARRWMESVGEAEKPYYEHFIEVNEEKLKAMTPREEVAPPAPCECGKPSAHKGICVARKVAAAAGKRAREAARLKALMPVPAVVEEEEAPLLHITITASKGERRYEVAGDNPVLLLWALDVIGNWE